MPENRSITSVVENTNENLKSPKSLINGSWKGKMRRRVEHQAAMGNKTHYYTSIPDPLNQAYIDGKVNDTLFRLIYVLFSHSRDFWITREYLEQRFSPSSLKKYLPVIAKSRIVDIEEVVLVDGKHPANIYHTNHPDDWDMSLILAMPRTGQNQKELNTSQVKERKSSRKTKDIGRRKKSFNTSPVKGSEVKDSEVNPIINPKGNQTKENQTKLNHHHSTESQDGSEERRRLDEPPDSPPPPKPMSDSQLIALRQSIEWIYVKTKKGGYTFEAVENAFADYISRRGLARAKALTLWMNENKRRYPETNCLWYVNEVDLRKGLSAVDALMDAENEAQANGMTLDEWQRYLADKEQEERFKAMQEAWQKSDAENNAKPSSLDLISF